MRISCLFILLHFTIVSSSKLIDEILSFYEIILKENNYKVVNVEALTLLMSYFDSDSICSLNCQKYLYNIVGEGIPFTELNVLVDKLYGDQISDDPFQPQEIHLAITSDKNAMKVMWVTMESLREPFVEYTLASENDWKSSKRNIALSYTYNVTEKWWPVFTGLIYETDMLELQTDTKYKYRVGGWDNVNRTIRYSDVFTFKSQPLNLPDRKTVVAALADHGTFMLFGFATINKLIEVQYNIDLDYVFVAGDLSYAGLDSAFKPLDITKDDEFEHIWDLLFIQNQPIAANYPWLVGDGNHEAFYNWTAFTNRYKMPQNSEINSVGNFWYDYDYGNIHWVSISSEHSLDSDSPQIEFLTKSLENAVNNRANVPWIIVSLHKPVYCSADGTPGGFADKLEDILIKYDVDLTITGHMHAYERVHPVADGIVTVYPTKKHIFSEDVYYSNSYGPVHIVQGNTGAMQFESWTQPQPAWSAVRFSNGFHPPNITSISVDLDGIGGPLLPSNYTNTFGFGVITAYNLTHLHYEAKADTEESVGTDSFWIVKRL